MPRSLTTMLRPFALSVAAVLGLGMGEGEAITSGQRAAVFSGGACSKLVQSCTRGYTYYVNSATGNNSNSGKSFGSPLKDITSLPAPTAGQSVCLEAGSSWRQQLTINADGVTVAGCGAGTKPILDASDVLANAGFTADGLGGYYTASKSFLASGQSGWVNVFEAGAAGDNAKGQFLTNVASQALVDATACSYYIPGLSNASNVPASGVIYLHACDSSNPISNGYTYEFSNRVAGLSMTSLGGVVANIEGRKPSGASGAIALNGDGYGYLASGVIARDGNKHVMFAPSGSTVQKSTLIDAYFGPSGYANLLVFFDGTSTGKNAYSLGNIYQVDQTGSATDGASALIQHTGSGNFGTISSIGDWFIAKNNLPMVGIGPQNAAALVVTGDYGSNVSAAVNFYQPTTISNSQFVASILPSDPLSYEANNLSLTLNNVEICAANEQHGMIVVGSFTGETLNISGGLYYINTPLGYGYMNYGITANAAISVAMTGARWGTAYSSQYIMMYMTAASGNAFVGANNIYEVVTGPFYAYFNNSLSYQGNWPPAGATDTGATFPATASVAINACTLPTIPSVN